MHIHNNDAVKRNIKFIENVNIHMDIQASENCCWNCFQSHMTYTGLWCKREMYEVDFRDLCTSWQERTTPPDY